jgi:hypothetical protein
MKLSEKLGLSISLRTAYRILNREIQKPLHVKSIFPSIRSGRDNGFPIKLNSEDWNLLTKSLKQMLKPFIERYNYEIVEIRQVKRKGRLKIEIMLEAAEEED